MEDMFSLGNVGLWRMASNGYMSLTGEVGELFITKILGTIILKLKYKDIVYAVSKNANERYFRVPTSEGGYFFYFDSFNELKETIEKNKCSQYLRTFFIPIMKIRYFFHSLLS